MTTTQSLTRPDGKAVELAISDIGGGQPFLLLHGGAGPASVAAFADLLSRTHGVRVLSPTHPGFNATIRPDDVDQMRDLATLYVQLVEDLDQRGLLSQTLVLATAEFGRTPQVNRAGGRDHWPWVYSVALAGGGTRPGTVYGASDASAARPSRNPHDPRDLAATVYHLLGVAADTVIHDQTNRPHALVLGDKIDGLLM